MPPDSASALHPSRAAERAAKRQWVGGITAAAGSGTGGSGDSKHPPPPTPPPSPPHDPSSSSSSSSSLPPRPHPPFPRARFMIFRWPWTIARIYRAYFLSVEQWARTANAAQRHEFRKAMLRYCLALAGWASLYGGAIWVWISSATSLAILWMADLPEAESSRVIERWFSVVFTPEGCAGIKEMVAHEREHLLKQKQQQQQATGKIDGEASGSEAAALTPSSKNE